MTQQNQYPAILNDTPIWLFDLSPDQGHPLCICSRCGQLIEDDGPAIRMFVNNGELEARFHSNCASKLKAFGRFELRNDEDPLDLGACCCCQQVRPDVRNLGMLDWQLPEDAPDRAGWGCVVCGLDSLGATYVACDDCMEKTASPTQIIWGYATKGERRPITDFDTTILHEHDLSKHQESRSLIDEYQIFE